MSCSGCLQSISDELFITCTYELCTKAYHRACINAPHHTAEEIKLWICPDCQASSRRGGDNTLTPVRTNDNITLRKKHSSQPNRDSGGSVDPDCTLQSLFTEIRCLRNDMAALQAEFLDRFDKLTSTLGSYETRIVALEQKEKENVLLRAQVSHLQDQLNNQAQASLSAELEILGLSESPNENSYHLVLTAANKIGVELDETDINFVSRAGPRDRKESHRLPRPLIVSFCRRTKREIFLKQAKARRSLDSRDIVGNGPERKVFVNERLTAENRRLFRTSRKWAADNDYKYCWSRNGKIFVRRREGRDGSPPIQIHHEDNLQNIPKDKIITGKLL